MLATTVKTSPKITIKHACMKSLQANDQSSTLSHSRGDHTVSIHQAVASVASQRPEEVSHLQWTRPRAPPL